MEEKITRIIGQPPELNIWGQILKWQVPVPHSTHNQTIEILYIGCPPGKIFVRDVFSQNIAEILVENFDLSTLFEVLDKLK